MDSHETGVVQATRNFGEPMFSLIDYPDGLDPDDVFDDAVIGMVTSHVCTTHPQPALEGRFKADRG